MELSRKMLWCSRAVIRQDGWGYALETSHPQVSVAYNNNGVFLTRAARLCRSLGRGLYSQSLGSPTWWRFLSTRTSTVAKTGNADLVNHELPFKTSLPKGCKLPLTFHWPKQVLQPSLISEQDPSADEWIKKLWYIYTMEYYSDIKKNSFESVLMRWMKLEPIIQSEVSQKEKHQYSILTHIYGI